MIDYMNISWASDKQYPTDTKRIKVWFYSFSELILYDVFYSVIQSHSSSLTDDEVKDARSGKNEVEKTIRAVYAQKKVCSLINIWQLQFLLSLYRFICYHVFFIIWNYTSGRAPYWWRRTRGIVSGNEERAETCCWGN